MPWIRLRLASYTNEVAAELGLFPKVFLQVNVGGEATKGGFEPETLRAEMERLLGFGSSGNHGPDVHPAGRARCGVGAAMVCGAPRTA